MLKASSGSSGLTAGSVEVLNLFRISAQSAGMLKPTSKSSLLIRCSATAQSVYFSTHASRREHWIYCAPGGRQSANARGAAPTPSLLQQCDAAGSCFAVTGARGAIGDVTPIIESRVTLGGEVMSSAHQLDLAAYLRKTFPSLTGSTILECFPYPAYSIQSIRSACRVWK